LRAILRSRGSVVSSGGGGGGGVATACNCIRGRGVDFWFFGFFPFPIGEWSGGELRLHF
jgi:hypothetical protein